MILGIIISILNIIGIIGFFNHFYILLYISAIASSIEEIIGVYSGQQKGFFAIPFSLLVGFIAFLNHHSFLITYSIIISFEGLITFILGLIPLLYLIKNGDKK